MESKRATFFGGVVAVASLITTVLGAAPAALANPTCTAASGVVSNGVSYDLSSDCTASVVGPSGSNASLTVPSTISASAEMFTVTAIQSNAFQNDTTLTTISLPSTISDIGVAAFEQSGLTSIDLSGLTGLTILNQGTFRAAPLTSVSLPTSLQTIGQSAFEATSLTNVNMSSLTSLTTISGWAFYNVPTLVSISLPSSVSSIGQSAFDTTGLTSVDLSGLTQLTFLTGWMFFNDARLTSVALPDSLQTIGQSVFQGTALTSLDLSSLTSLTTVVGWAFYDIPTLNSITLPSSVSSIGQSAFEGTALTSIDLSGLTQLTALSGWTFYDVLTLTSVALPTSITTIGQSAFQATGIQTIDLSGLTGLTAIGQYAFYDDNSLVTAIFPASNFTIGDDAFLVTSNLSPVFRGNLPLASPNNPFSTGTVLHYCGTATDWFGYAVTTGDCTMQFQTGGGSVVAPALVAYGSNFVAPAPPVRSGYDFAGWYSDSDFTQAMNFPVGARQNLTAYAKWVPSVPSTELASTGTNAWPLTVAAMLALAFGALLVRRRHVSIRT